MTDRNEVANHEKLIKEAAEAIAFAPPMGDARAEARRDAEIAYSVFEKVLGEATITPTDNEREALERVLLTSFDYADIDPSVRELADAILAAGFRRSEVPEPSADHMDALSRIDQATAYVRASWLGTGEPTPNTPAGEIIAILRGVRTFTPEPQGEPSDAQVMAAIQVFYNAPGVTDWVDETKEDMRAALRAANEVR